MFKWVTWRHLLACDVVVTAYFSCAAALASDAGDVFSTVVLLAIAVYSAMGLVDDLVKRPWDES